MYGGVSLAMKDQIRKLSSYGYSIRGISRALHLSRNTVRKYLKENASNSHSQGAGAPVWGLKVDWGYVVSQRKKGVTLRQLYIELAPEGVSYWSFGSYIRKNLKPLKLPTIHLTHKPGEKVQVDYAEGIKIIDRRTGKPNRTQLFCGVLPFSSYTFGEFSLDQKQPSFISSHQHMWAFFGGVTPYVVIDNLKSGVKKAHIYDPDVNKTYCDYGNHDGFSVLPARPFKPRDKGAVESAIGAIQRSFYQEVRERTFYSLFELNQCFQEFLVRFNNNVMKEYGVSRLERFEEEKKHLKPLPQGQYQLKTWKIAKVHPDSTVQIDKNFYSVPYKYIGQTVNVRLSKGYVEVFAENLDAITSHSRCLGMGKKSIKTEHYPSEKDQLSRFDIKKAKAQADAIGPKMSTVMASIFNKPRPLENLRRAQGMLRVWRTKGMTREAMEYAASQCLTFARFRVDYFRNCALHAMGHGPDPVKSVPKRDKHEVYLHNYRIKEDS